MSYGNLSWFTTPAGKKCMGIAATGASFAMFAIQYAPHTFLHEKYRDFVSLRRHGKFFPVSTELQNTFDKVLNDLKLSKFQKSLIEPFMVYGYDVWHSGSMNTAYGAKIGLPINYNYKKPEEIDKSGILINDELINWNRKEAHSLLDALIVSENAIKYSIAREILMTNNYNVMVQAGVGCFLTFSYYLVASIINERFQLYDKPRRLRFVMYGLVGLFIWGVWVMQKDGITKYYEYYADEKASQLGIDYIKGGLEFYRKSIQRNIALRDLGGSNGEKTFTKGGNDIITFREKHIPNSSRKQFFEEALKDYENRKIINIDAEPAIA